VATQHRQRGEVTQDLLPHLHMMEASGSLELEVE
jgi:hypothetical protein